MTEHETHQEHKPSPEAQLGDTDKVVLRTMGAKGLDLDANPTDDVRGERMTVKEVIALSEELVPGTTAADLLDDVEGRFIPKRKLNISDREFMTTRILDAGDYALCVAYTRGTDGTVLPRLFYKSRSGGDWRATPGMAAGSFVKSDAVNNLGGEYTQTTKVVSQLRDALHAEEETRHTKEVTMEEIHRMFSYTRQGKEGADTFDKEVISETLGADSEAQRDALYDTYEPGKGLLVDADTAHDRLGSDVLNYLMPDVSQPVGEYTYRHALAGEVTVRDYTIEKNGVQYTWSFAEDNDGNVWVEQIRHNKSWVTSYGTSGRVLMAGPYSAKPFEYRDQIRGLDPTTDYESVPGSKYVDIRPFLQNLGIIKAYKQARHM